MLSEKSEETNTHSSVAFFGVHRNYFPTIVFFIDTNYITSEKIQIQIIKIVWEWEESTKTKENIKIWVLKQGS